MDIWIDGVNGAGKTTLAKKLVEDTRDAVYVKLPSKQTLLLIQKDPTREVPLLLRRNMLEHTKACSFTRVFDRTILSFYVYQVILKRLISFESLIEFIKLYPLALKQPKEIYIKTEVYREDRDGDILDSCDRNQEIAVWKIVESVPYKRQGVVNYLTEIHEKMLTSGLYIV